MNKNLLALAWGLLFGVGLIIAQMTNPQKVLAFLDVAGEWDPSLAFVMIGALSTLGIAQHWINRAQRTAGFNQNGANVDNSLASIDVKLVLGAAVFGIGWGLSGFCPGPALVALSSGLTGSYVFGGALFAGFALFSWLHKRG